MSALPEDHNPRGRWILYIGASVLALVLVVVGLVAYRGHADTQEAQAKAATLATAIEAAGYPAPNTEAIARLLGTDGGAACANPGDLSRGLAKIGLGSGASGPGMRPGRVDRVTVAGEGLIISTYCPEKLPEFQAFVDTLTFYDTVRNG